MNERTTPGGAPATTGTGRGTGVLLGAAAAGRCRRRVHLEHAPDAPRDRLAAPDDGLRMRLAEMTAHTDDVLTTVASAPAGAVDGWSPASAERPPVVRRPVLRGAHRIGVPDLLVRMPDGGYVPVLVRGHRTLEKGSGALLSPVSDPLTTVVDPRRRARRHHGDELQLAHHRALLLELGLSSTVPWGGVIGRGSPFTAVESAPELAAAGITADDDGAVVLWHDLTEVQAEYTERFADRLAVAEAAARGDELAAPSRIAECRRCPWWPVCEPELRARQDVSLLAAGADADELHAAGLSTLQDVAAAPAELLQGLTLTTVRTDELAVKARAMLRGMPLVRRTRDGRARRADVELDVDMESFLDRGAYLWGTLLAGADIGLPHGYRPFVQWDDLDDGGAGCFAEFWAFLAEVRRRCAERGLTLAAYCWSRTAEERWMYAVPRTFGDHPGVPTEAQVAAFCSSPQWIDLFAEVKRVFVVTGSMRLKVIAPIAGFHWRDETPGGENSMAWFREAIGLVGADEQVGDGGRDDAAVPTPAQRTARQRLLDYNEDDVRATAAIRRWMEDGALALPTVAELSAAG